MYDIWSVATGIASFLQIESQEGALPQQNFFFDPKTLAAGQKRKQQESCEGRRGPPFKRRAQPVSRGPCWFCLGGEQVEKHLVVSVGEHVSLYTIILA